MSKRPMPRLVPNRRSPRPHYTLNLYDPVLDSTVATTDDPEPQWLYGGNLRGEWAKVVARDEPIDLSREDLRMAIGNNREALRGVLPYPWWFLRLLAWWYGRKRGDK